LVKYKPDSVKIVYDQKEADLTILHVIGRQDRIYDEAYNSKKYVVIQYALRSTLRSNVHGWINLWDNARLVWSYLDLEELCLEDKVIPDFNFYHSPLGVEDVFFNKHIDRNYIVATSGQSYLTESVRECILAAGDKRVFHLGEELKRPNTDCFTGISDQQLCDLYNQSVYVSGMRRIEGFELPALEGLMCGCIPIFFDRPHYKQWFNGLGVFIPEGNRQQVINSLQLIFDGQPSTSDRMFVIEFAKTRFNWHTIISEFWERAL
jgi:hypothetical protein